MCREALTLWFPSASCFPWAIARASEAAGAPSTLEDGLHHAGVDACIAGSEEEIASGRWCSRVDSDELEAVVCFDACPPPRDARAAQGNWYFGGGPYW